MLRVAQGGTLRIPAIYRNAQNALVDPTDPKVDILDPANTVVVNDAPLVREDVGTYHYDHTAAANATLGDWTARFYGVIEGFTASGDEPFEVVEPGSINAPGVNLLLSVEEAKERLDIDPTDERYDTELFRALESASDAIRAFTGRDFAAPLITQERTYAYDGSGYLDIDDANAVTAVVLVNQGYPDTTLTTEEWVAQPQRSDESPVYTYVLMPGIHAWGGSPEMGFTRNLDVLYSEGRWRQLPPTVKVTGTWGWPNVPADVRQAAFWTMEEFRGTKAGTANENLQSESIEGFARTWNRRAAMLAIPNRARDLLANYGRWYV